MSILFAILCIVTALLMVILSRIEVDIKYKESLLVILHISILAVELRNKKRKNKSNNSGAQTSAIIKLRRGAAYAKLITELIEGSDVRLNNITLPDPLPDDYRTAYIKNAVYSSIVSIFSAYLTSKSQKLNESDDAYDRRSEAFLIDVTLTTRILNVLRSLFVMKKRIMAIEAEETE